MAFGLQPSLYRGIDLSRFVLKSEDYPHALAYNIDITNCWPSTTTLAVIKLNAIAAKLCGDENRLKVTTIKEKYGTLRIYTNWTTDEIEEVITGAEDRSASLCCVCEDSGSLLRSRGWYLTLCDVHAREKGYIS